MKDSYAINVRDQLSGSGLQSEMGCFASRTLDGGSISGLGSCNHLQVLTRSPSLTKKRRKFTLIGGSDLTFEG